MTRTSRASARPGLPSRVPAFLRRRQSGFRALGNQRAFFFGQRGVNVQHERIDVRPQLRDDERHVVDHEAGNKVNVA